LVSLLLGDKGKIDFETPIFMTDSQREQFMSLLNELFDPVEVDYVSEFRSDRLGPNKEIHGKWTAREYQTLLNVEDFSVVAHKLGRTDMSVVMMLGKIVPRLILWCEEKNLSFANIALSDIELYIKEKEAKKLEKRRLRKVRTETANKIEKILDDKKLPCLVGDSGIYGGECENGFNKYCCTCPRSKGFIKTDADIKLFNKIYSEEFE